MQNEDRMDSLVIVLPLCSATAPTSMVRIVGIAGTLETMRTRTRTRTRRTMGRMKGLLPLLLPAAWYPRDAARG